MARCVMHGKKNRFLLSAMMDKNHHGKGGKEFISLPEKHVTFLPKGGFL